MNPDLLCPISSTMMTDPVLLVETGQTYERSNILKWFETCRNESKPLTDPISGAVLKSSRFIKNWAIYRMLPSNEALSECPKNIKNAKISKAAFTECRFVSTSFKDSISTYKCLSNSGSALDLTLVVLVDVSGSMDAASSSKSEASIYSRLALVKIALEVLIMMSLPTTKLCIISFSDTADVIFETDFMTKSNKTLAVECVKKLRTKGGTNFSNALLQAINTLPDCLNDSYRQVDCLNDSYRQVDCNRNVCAMLLTDGEPTDKVSDILTLISHENTPCIYTIAIGTSSELNSELLYEIAHKTNGSYAYIPDASCIGDVFVCLMASLLYVCDSKNQLRAHSYKYVPYSGADVFNEVESLEDKFYLKFISLLKKVYTLAKTSREQKAIVELLEFVEDNPEDLYKIYTEDIVSPEMSKGQILKSIQNWSTWGRHYFPAVLSAHINRIQSNLKDESTKLYSDTVVKQIINNGIYIYDNLDPPEPDITPKHMTLITPVHPQDRLRTIRGSGCFSGGTLITLEDGTLCPIREITKGTVLLNGYIVECVVQSEIGSHEIVQIEDNVEISPNHPILDFSHENWTFPIYYKDVSKHIYTVYNFVLSKCHTVKLGQNTIACTLGHGFTEPIVKHPYLGTHKVIDDLKKMKGYDLGRVFLKGSDRDPVTGIVTRFF